MKIPKKFKLCGHEICVEFDSNLYNKEDAFGNTRYRTNKIHIDNNGSQATTQIEETFFHEMTHWILYSMSNKLYDDETFVEQFSKLLHQAITTMEY